MKKIIEFSFIILLTLFSFYYTYRLADISRSQDDIMIKIKEVSFAYEKDAIDAKIDDKYIISGISGIKVNLNESYNKMKGLGSYNSNLLVFDDILPSVSVSSCYDKVITSGNGLTRNISLIFKINKIDDYKKLALIAKEKNVKFTFFIDGFLIDNYKEDILEYLDYVYLENNGYNKFFLLSNISYTNNLIKSLTGSKPKYLFYNDDNDFLLSKNLKMPLVLPKTINSNNMYNEFKDNLKQTGLYYFTIDNYTYKSLNSILDIIYQKGYQVSSIEKVLEE